ncbi:MAG: hypothetical protein QGF59_26180 [Pirellulaceae bacterium]|jgi:hypothetical protein|nr:hypothetical protein [Pirellulaceae bacterium]
MTLANSLIDYIRACCSGIWIQSHEHEDALADIARICAEQQWHLATWDIEQGMRIPGHTSEDAAANDPLAAIRAVNALATPDGAALLVLTNFRALCHNILHFSARVLALRGRRAALFFPVS